MPYLSWHFAGNFQVNDLPYAYPYLAKQIGLYALKTNWKCCATKNMKNSKKKLERDLARVNEGIEG